DKDYIVANGEVKIVDEFTGRILDGRRWSDGLHQAVEAKEGVKIKEENQTLATITLQNYFRLYDKLAGMTGTAETEAAEFYNTYGLHVVPIPTNKPVVRDDQVDLVYRSESGKFGAVLDDIVARNEAGQPVLVGTISVEKSELLAGLLEKNGIEHSVLNAKLHAREADIVAQAGRLGAVTVATNMAGRGVDIVLGGNPEGLAERDVLAEGLELESEDGQARFDELLAKYEPQCTAEGEKVKDLGGLYVVATERHDSRRIDNQLRGRSGRQGDPGESRFYLSLEDELMRLFATGAMDWVMKRALPDDLAIDSKMVTKAIERAQNTVEQRNAETRKNVLKYDEVMNEQRRVIYARRNQILEGADLRDEALEYLAEAVDAAIGTYCVSDFSEEWDLEGLANELNGLWPNELAAEDLSHAETTDQMYEKVMSEGVAYYEEREEEIGADIMRQIERQVMLRIIDQRWREHLYEMDYLKEGIHLRAMGQKDPLTEWQREGFEMFGTMMASIAQDFVKYVTHIQVNDQGQEAQPADEQSQATNVEESGPDESAGAERMAAAAQGSPIDDADMPEVVEENEAPSNTPVVKSDFEKTGRNEPCPCGSGKKFKHCHG
ncbi:MAG: SEC-C metal-binding domain-containing protein, partial [Actinomycetota bacterium]